MSAKKTRRQSGGSKFAGGFFRYLYDSGLLLSAEARTFQKLKNFAELVAVATLFPGEAYG